MEKISLPPMLIKFAEQKVSEGLYRDQSEVLGEALRKVMEKENLDAMATSNAAYFGSRMLLEEIYDDIRLIMAELKMINVAKEKLRELIKDLNNWISDEMGKFSRNENKDSEDIDNEPIHQGLNVDNVNGKVLGSMLDALDSNLDRLDDLSELTLLHLQTIEDRFSTILQTHCGQAKSAPQPKRKKIA